MDFNTEQLIFIIIALSVTYFIFKFIQPKKTKKFDPLDKINITLNDIHKEIIEIKSNAIFNKNK